MALSEFISLTPSSTSITIKFACQKGTSPQTSYLYVYQRKNSTQLTWSKTSETTEDNEPIYKCTVTGFIAGQSYTGRIVNTSVTGDGPTASQIIYPTGNALSWTMTGTSTVKYLSTKVTITRATATLKYYNENNVLSTCNSNSTIKIYPNSNFYLSAFSPNASGIYPGRFEYQNTGNTYVGGKNITASSTLGSTFSFNAGPYTTTVGNITIAATEKPATSNVYVSITDGIKSYVVDGQTYSASKTFTVTLGTDGTANFNISSVTYKDGYKKSGDGSGNYEVGSTNLSITLGSVKITYYTLTIWDYDWNEETNILAKARTFSVESGTKVTPKSEYQMSTTGTGWKYYGWGTTGTSSSSDTSFTVTSNRTVFYFYTNVKLTISASSTSTYGIQVTTANGVANYNYSIIPTADGNWTPKSSGKTSNSSYTFASLPLGRSYKITVTEGDGESDTETHAHKLTSISGPSISVSSSTLDQSTGKYTVTFAISKAGYTQASSTQSFSTGTTTSSTSLTVSGLSYNEKVTIYFRYKWDENYLYDTAELTLALTKPSFYVYTSAAYYWNGESAGGAFDTGSAYSLSSVTRPVYTAYPETSYLGFEKTINNVKSSGSGTAVGLSSDYTTTILWKYRKDAYPYKIRLFYYDTDGNEVEETDGYPLEKLYNLDSSIQISGNLTGKGQLSYYLIGTNRFNGNGSDIYTIDLTNYKNTLAEIRAYFYMNFEWTTSPQLVSNTNTLTAAWKGGRAGYRFEFFTDYTHHYYPGPSGYSTSRSYTSSHNLPGGYVWKAQVIDRTRNTLGPVTISNLKKPTYNANTLGLDPSNNKLYLTAKVLPFPNTGYHAARLEYKRSTDSDWTKTGKYTEATTGTTNLSFYIETDVRNNTNDSIIYQSRVVWYKSDYDEENGYKYEHSSTIATWPIGYKIQLEISDKIQSLNVSYVTAANEVKLNYDLSGNTTHTLWLQHGSKLVINSFSPVPGWHSPDFSIGQGESEEIFGPATYTFDLLEQTEHYRVYLYCGDNISRFTVRYCDFIKYNNLGSLDQAMTNKTITREDSPQTIEVPLERSNFTIESWTGEDANASMYDESTMSPTPTIVGGKYAYDAARFAFGDFIFNIDFYKTKFTKSAYVDYCTFQLIDENGIRDSEQITLTSDADGIYFYEFSPTQPYHTQIKIIDYKLIAGRKNFYMNISGDSERYYLKDYLNNLIPIERGESYIFNGDDYTNPSVTIEPDKYSVTCSYSYIDEEVFLGSPHKVTFTQQESGTKITKFIDFKTTKSITFTNTIVNNKYSIFADTEFTILTELWDAQSNRWIEIASEGNKTLPRDIPDFTIQPNISNRAYGDISNYQDYDKVVSYHWNITASLADATSITVIDNKTENVNTQKIPSGNQPFELDSTYYARIVLGATDGSDATWTSKWVKIDTPDAYTITFVLNNISSIAAKSDLTNNENKIFENNGVLTVSPNSAYEISGINSYSSLTTPYNRKMFYTSPVYYTITKDGNKIQNGVFVNRDNSVSKITGNMDTPALTITLTATPADWVWPNGYTKDTTTTGTPILTKGGPVNLFEYEAWNELMFYLNKWGQYLNKLYTNYENTLMTSENKTLTAAIYNHAYAQLNTLFTNLSDAIITNAVSNKTQVTAKGLEDFGNTINYNNIKE